MCYTFIIEWFWGDLKITELLLAMLKKQELIFFSTKKLNFDVLEITKGFPIQKVNTTNIKFHWI